jgi:hypothetical protein
MRIMVSLILCTITPLALLAQSFTVGGTGRDWGTAVATDEAGNSYVAFVFTGTVDLDPGMGEHMVTSELDFGGVIPSMDVALASYTPSGTLRWGFSFGSPGFDRITRIEMGNGRIVAVGSINGPVYDIDPGEVLVSIDAPSRRYSALIASFDTAGRYQWSRAFGDTIRGDGTRAYDVYMRDDGSVVATGQFLGTVDADGPDAPIKPWVSKAIDTDVWIGCWSSSGEMLWGEPFGGIGHDEGRAIVGTAESFHIAGIFQQVIDLDPTDAVLEQTSAGSYDIFLGRYLDSARVQWGTRWGGRNLNLGSDNIAPGCLAQHTDGSLSAAFAAWDTCTFGNDARPPFLVSRGMQDIAVVHLDPLGTHQWSFVVGGDKLGDQPLSLMVTDAGSILVGGWFWGTVDLDPSTAVATFRAASDSASAAFIAQYSADGEYQWARAFSAPNTNSSRNETASIVSIAIDRANTDEIIAAGTFSGTTTLGTAPGFGTVRVTSEGIDDAIVLRLDQSGAIMFDALTSVDADDHTRDACDIRTTSVGVEVAMRSGGALRVALYDLMGRRLASAAADHGHIVLPLEKNEPCIVVVESDQQRYTARILRY